MRVPQFPAAPPDITIVLLICLPCGVVTISILSTTYLLMDPFPYFVECEERHFFYKRELLHISPVDGAAPHPHHLADPINRVS